MGVMGSAEASSKRKVNKKELAAGAGFVVGGGAIAGGIAHEQATKSITPWSKFVDQVEEATKIDTSALTGKDVTYDFGGNKLTATVNVSPGEAYTKALTKLESQYTSVKGVEVTGETQTYKLQDITSTKNPNAV